MVGCFARCREREGVRETGRRDDETENDWERLRMAGKRANETTGQRDHGTAGLRDHETTRLRDYGTTGQRDNETTGLLKKTQAFTGVLRRSQAFSVVRGSAWQCVAAWRQKGADVVPSRSLAGWGCTWAYIPIQTNELGAADAPLSRQELGVRRAPSATLGKNAVDG